MTDRSERQQRVEELTERGYSAGEAQGIVRCEEAGIEPPKTGGVDPAGTIGFDRPGSKRD
jgi:hypothetical protein